MDKWGTYETPCPNCKGEVKYWFFDSDCRGNPGSSGIQCKGCKREFTSAEWKIIASEEMKQERTKEALAQLAFKAKYVKDALGRYAKDVGRLSEELFSGKKPTELAPELANLHRRILDYAEAFGKYEKLSG